MIKKTVMLTVQKWGNSLTVRIPAMLARSARLRIGTLVELKVQDHSIIVKAIGERHLTLAERLELFDPEKHGGEAMIF